jgi:hypothetical protein
VNDSQPETKHEQWEIDAASAQVLSSVQSRSVETQLALTAFNKLHPNLPGAQSRVYFKLWEAMEHFRKANEVLSEILDSLVKRRDKGYAEHQAVRQAQSEQIRGTAKRAPRVGKRAS